jgi:putative oxidoreductase
MVALAIRVLLVALFLPFSALDKILNFHAAVRQCEQTVASGQLAIGLLLCGFTVEILMSAAILAGIADRAAALVLALYCIATALLWKKFWREADFRLSGQSRGRDVFWDFEKRGARRWLSCSCERRHCVRCPTFH